MTLSNEQVIEKAKQHGLMLKEDSLKRNESGLDFQVVIAADIYEENWVLRIPRRADVILTAKKEKQILDFVGQRLYIESPKWTIFSEELIAYKLLKGVPAGTIDAEAKAYVWELDEKNIPDIFHETLAKAMADLHAINIKEAEQAGLVIKTAEELQKTMQERMDKVKSVFGVSEELWTRWQKWLANDELWPKQTAVIHGDLHAGHILIDKEAKVTGFIDWTEARVDDLSNDFVVHLAAFGEDALKRLIYEYKKAGGYVWPSMIEHITELLSAFPIGIAEFAMKSGSDEYEEMAKQALGAIKE
ncbi:macrolide phosphotransferase [Cytobacillus eiseniae]|uniref:Macrolide phosphotransferase n=1 Tax=Cytobacillus eiseniae TaxID=762947 RepID=A0ABS4RIJ0_9BACI|nr:macrolide 2'-phosphotransferase [Cytobacillus eiseniae]MBP2242725.1 macrolide phosphotransferase [Cytobacillus eiseniae]